MSGCGRVFRNGFCPGAGTAFRLCINIPVIIILGKYALRALKDYEKQKKAGIDPVFRAEDIDLPHEVDYWD